MTSCVYCDNKMLEIREARTLNVAGRSVTVEHELLYCRHCDEELMLPEQVDAVLRRASSMIREEEGLLDSSEIVDLRTRLGLSQANFEKLLGAGPKTAVRWEKGTVFQSKTVDNLMRVMREIPEATQWLATRNGVFIAPAKVSKSRMTKGSGTRQTGS